MRIEQIWCALSERINIVSPTLAYLILRINFTRQKCQVWPNSVTTYQSCQNWPYYVCSLEKKACEIWPDSANSGEERKHVKCCHILMIKHAGFAKSCQFSGERKQNCPDKAYRLWPYYHGYDMPNFCLICRFSGQMWMNKSS